MRLSLTRLLAGVFVCLAFAGCPRPAPAKPQPPPPAPQLLWYTWDWPDPVAFDPARLQASGITGVLAVATGHQFDPQNRALSLDELRSWATPLKAKAGPLAVWWTFSTVRQADNPTAGSPARTLCDPRDQAQRNQLLGNYSSIGRVAREMGFAGVALDAEMFGGGGVAWPEEPGCKDLGGALVTAIRQNYPACRLAAFGPLAGAPAGFKKVWRGFSAAAGDAVFFTEDTYGLSGQDAKGIQKALNRCGDLTGARYPAAGWFASTKAPNVAGWFQAAVPQLQVASRISPYVMVYREGTMQPPEWDALGQTLRAVRQ